MSQMQPKRCTIFRAKKIAQRGHAAPESLPGIEASHGATKKHAMRNRGAGQTGKENAMNFNAKKFEETVRTVTTEATDGNQANKDRRAAEAALLDKVIEMARPALAAIGTRPVIGCNIRHHGDVNYCGGDNTEERYGSRCVLLSGDSWGPEEDFPRANAGNFEGVELAVRAPSKTSYAKLIQFRYSGSWSRWQGSSWGWEAEITEYDSAAEAVADGWIDVEEYIERLGELLEKAVGKRKKRIAADKARAAKITAIKTIL